MEKNRAYLYSFILSTFTLIFFIKYVCYEEPHTLRNYDKYHYYIMKLDAHEPLDIINVSQKLEIDYLGNVGQFDNYFQFRKRKYKHISHQHPIDTHGHKLTRRESDLVSQRMTLETLRKRVKRIMNSPSDTLEKRAPLNSFNASRYEALGIRDPGFPRQWHISNRKYPGKDFNITSLWEEGITGKGVTVSIVDDGVDFNHKDMLGAFDSKGSFDFNDHVPTPLPTLPEDVHGTRCAGQIAAQKNDVCGVGLAYDSKIAGIRILSKQISDSDEALAIIYGYQTSQIYSCSWGPPDNGEAMDLPPQIVVDAIEKGTVEGRGGLGSVYVFASGNGGYKGDNCNFDGYTNSIYSITVGAIDEHDTAPQYSEACTALLVSAYSGGMFDRKIYTMSSWHNQCTDEHGGTSAAAPFVAGVSALALSVRPDLSWRDMQYITINSAVPIQHDDPSWGNTAVPGRRYSSVYGYGKIDAYKFVKEAQKFKNVNNQTRIQSPVIPVNKVIPSNKQGLKMTFEITEEDIKKANMKFLEHVVITVNAKHERRGDLRFELTSPNGIFSLIGEPRMPDDTDEGFVNWPFMTVKHWEEQPKGVWTLIVKDEMNPQYTGKMVDFKITFYGQSNSHIDKPIVPLPPPISHPTPVTPSPIKPSPIKPPSKTPPVRPTITKPNKPGGNKNASIKEPQPSLIKEPQSKGLPVIPSWLMFILFGPILILLLVLLVMGIRAYRNRDSIRLSGNDIENDGDLDDEKGPLFQSETVFNNDFFDDDIISRDPLVLPPSNTGMEGSHIKDSYSEVGL